jgi:hypothetical protein
VTPKKPEDYNHKELAGPIDPAGSSRHPLGGFLMKTNLFWFGSGKVINFEVKTKLGMEGDIITGSKIKPGLQVYRLMHVLAMTPICC